MVFSTVNTELNGVSFSIAVEPVDFGNVFPSPKAIDDACGRVVTFIKKLLPRFLLVSDDFVRVKHECSLFCFMILMTKVETEGALAFEVLTDDLNVLVWGSVGYCFALVGNSRRHGLAEEIARVAAAAKEVPSTCACSVRRQVKLGKELQHLLDLVRQMDIKIIDCQCGDRECFRVLTWGMVDAIGEFLKAGRRFVDNVSCWFDVADLTCPCQALTRQAAVLLARIENRVEKKFDM